MLEKYKSYKKYVFGIIASISLSIYLSLIRNNWYGDFLQTIEQRGPIKFSIIYFIILAVIIVLNDFIKDVLEIKFITKNRNSNFKQQDLIQTQNQTVEFSQRIAEDQHYQAKHFIKALDFWILSVGTVLVFLPRLIFLTKGNRIFVLSVLIIYSSLIFLLNFGYIKKLLQSKRANFENNEASLRKFLASWLDKHCIRPIKFSNQYLIKAKKHMEQYYITKKLIDSSISLYQSIALVLPFAVFYSLYSSNKIGFAQFMQLINLWTHLSYAITNFAQGIKNYVLFDITKQRLHYKIDNKINYQNNGIKLENITIKINNQKELIKNFNLNIKEGDKINIIGPNGAGKTSLMHAMQGMIEYEGNISISENIVWIPEQPILPETTSSELSTSKEFEKACKLFEIAYSNNFSNLSGAEKWKIIAAYSMLFKTIVWDDPFWGLNINEQIQKLISTEKTIVIFSQNPIENMQHIYL